MSFRELERATRQLSGDYRDAHPPLEMSAIDTLAYAVTRLPATETACRNALQAICDVQPGFQPRSHLDLGSGCGAGLLAARDLWPDLVHQTGIDHDRQMSLLGTRLVPTKSHVVCKELAQWASSAREPVADLVTASYSLGELPGAVGDAVVLAAWRATGGVLLLVEPGTPRGFADICRWRSILIGEGARVTAPCPHDDDCPMLPGDWCHFAARVERSVLHRRLKRGSAGYEDERFSYVALMRPQLAHLMAGNTPAEGLPRSARVIRHPWRSKGRVDLTLCTAEGLRRETVRRNDPGYRTASRARWGARL
ncbi:MAG: small ribosomal subunit Rsm22 family protein [Acidimicrobiales bacterium]